MPGASGGQKRVLDPQELELRMTELQMSGSWEPNLEEQPVFSTTEISPALTEFLS